MNWTSLLRKIATGASLASVSAVTGFNSTTPTTDIRATNLHPIPTVASRINSFLDVQDPRILLARTAAVESYTGQSLTTTFRVPDLGGASGKYFHKDVSNSDIFYTGKESWNKALPDLTHNRVMTAGVHGGGGFGIGSPEHIPGTQASVTDWSLMSLKRFGSDLGRANLHNDLKLVTLLNCNAPHILSKGFRDLSLAEGISSARAMDLAKPGNVFHLLNENNEITVNFGRHGKYSSHVTSRNLPAPNFDHIPKIISVNQPGLSFFSPKDFGTELGPSWLDMKMMSGHYVSLGDNVNIPADGHSILHASASEIKSAESSIGQATNEFKNFLAKSTAKSTVKQEVTKLSSRISSPFETAVGAEFSFGLAGIGGFAGLLKRRKRTESKTNEKIADRASASPKSSITSTETLAETAQIAHQATIEEISTLPDSVRSLPMRGSKVEPGTLSMGRFGGYDVKPTRSSADTWLESSREWERRRANKVEQRLNRISNPRQIVNEQRKLTAQSINERRAAARAARQAVSRTETSSSALQERLTQYKRNKPRSERLPDSVPALPQYGTSMPTSEYVKGKFGGYDVGPTRSSDRVLGSDFYEKSNYEFWEQGIREQKEEFYGGLEKQRQEHLTSLNKGSDGLTARERAAQERTQERIEAEKFSAETERLADEAISRPLPDISKPKPKPRNKNKKPQAIHEAAKPENIAKEVHTQRTKTPSPPPTTPLPPNEAVGNVKKPKKSYRTYSVSEKIAEEATKEATETIARDISKDLIKGIRNEHLAIAGGVVAGASLLMMAFGKFQHKGKVYKHPMTGRQARAQKRGRDAASAAGALGLVSLTNKRLTPIGRRKLFFGSMWGLGTVGDGLDGNVGTGILSNTLATAAAYSAMLFATGHSGKGLSALKDTLHSNDFRGVSHAFQNIRKLFPLVDREMVGYMAAAGTFPVAHSIIQQTLMGHSRKSNKIANPTLMAHNTAGLEYQKDDTVPFKGIGPTDLSFGGSLSTSYNSQAALQSFR